METAESLETLHSGEGGHAGAVLMPDRHDAGLAGAEIALAVELAAQSSGSPDAVGTTGVFRQDVYKHPAFVGTVLS